MRLPNRKIAGELLAEQLIQYKNNSNVIVLALPRGGIPIGYEISKKLNVPLDAFLVRKLGVPWHEELAMGAIAMGNVKFINQQIIGDLNISETEINQIVAREEKELTRRNELYRNDAPLPNLSNKIVVLVDDGLATGATMFAAAMAIKKLNPKKLIIAVPVAPAEAPSQFKSVADEFLALMLPDNLFAISQWYEEFPQTSDAEVIELLQDAKKNAI